MDTSQGSTNVDRNQYYTARDILDTGEGWPKLDEVTYTEITLDTRDG